MADKKKKQEDIKVTDAEEVTETAQSEENTENAEADITVDDLIKKLAELKKRADDEKQRADDMTKVAITLRADFDNYRKRSREESAKAVEKGNVEVLEKIIPVIDVVEQAITMIPDENVRKGVEMIQGQLTMLLSSYKVEEIEAKGLDFDPKVHEAIMQVDGKEEDSGKIADVFQKGYKMGDRVIRCAKVTVVK
ncbi:MAG: nucleotide exchange factor GrpE [Clostridiales bacterium]|nr:nucleotide exchange factor GrpE [Clostridiales bacterium]